MALLEQGKTSFAGFGLPGARWPPIAPRPFGPEDGNPRGPGGCGPAGVLQGAQQKTPPDKLGPVNDVINSLADLLQKTVKSGRVDAAATVLLDPQAATGLLGISVADGGLLQKVLCAAVDVVGRENPVVADMVKLDADRAGPIHFNTISIPFPADAKNREKAVQLFGEKLEVVIGVGPQIAYLAAGRNALDTLKRLIETSAAQPSRQATPVDVSVDLERLVGFGAVMGEPKDQPKAALVAGELKKTPGKNHVSLVARPIPNGVQFHLEVEPGIIHAIGRIVVLSQQHKI